MLVARRDDVAFGHEERLDDPAFEVLDDLVAARGDEASLRDHRGGERRGEGPQAEAAEGERHERQAEDRVAADRPRDLGIPFGGGVVDGDVSHGRGLPAAPGPRRGPASGR